MCSVYFKIKNDQPIFVWGMFNQYYMVNTCLWQRHSSVFNDLYFVWMCLPNASVYVLFINLPILSNIIYHKY